MNAQNVNQILDALAARFGSTGAHLWAVLLRQVYIDAARAALAALVAVGGAWYEFRAFYKMSGRDRDEYWYVLAFGALLGGLALAASFGVISRLLNPDYAALQLVLSATRGG